MKVTNIVDHIDTFRRNTHQEALAEGIRPVADPKATRESAEEVRQVVEKLNREVAPLRERVSFSYHEKAHTIVMKVHDPQTGEIVREIPSRDSIKLLEHIREYLGLFVDESR